MAGNSFGSLFRITTWGESHGQGVGVVIDGCPAGLSLRVSDIQHELNRRRPGQSKVTTPRNEQDSVQILSGVFENKTTGTPISLMVMNADQHSRDYGELVTKYRPSHADYTYDAKYGFRDHRGGGRASARETIGRVAAAAIAKKYLFRKNKIEVIAYVKQIHTLKAEVDPKTVTQQQIESNLVRCPDAAMAEKMITRIENAKTAGDSLGGIVECVIRHVPAGIGSPVFDKLEARLAHAMLSLPATKGFEIGSGFAATLMKGSEHNDDMRMRDGKMVTTTNHSGGVVGGISNGMDIIFRVAFKPTATIFKKQNTIDAAGQNTTLQMSGRHDACVLPRAVHIVEAMAALVVMDEYLLQKTVR
ncbi:chorismate synthase [Candidatus Peregrinibacteria bacterium]|nr:MAG: chorismate synthase [Candidatus Peregrinibacteria bacterium]